MAVANSWVIIYPPVELGGVPPLDIVLEALKGLNTEPGAVLVRVFPSLPPAAEEPFPRAPDRPSRPQTFQVPIGPFGLHMMCRLRWPRPALVASHGLATGVAPQVTRHQCRSNPRRWRRRLVGN